MSTPKEEFAYCRLHKSKFLIMSRIIGTNTAWNRYAEAVHEPAAKRVVKALNDTKNPTNKFVS